MMQTYVKIEETYLHVFIHITANRLWLRSQQGLRQAIVREIDLSKLTNFFVMELFGSKQISFTYEGESFIIYEAGLGVSDYLETNLIAK